MEIPVHCANANANMVNMEIRPAKEHFAHSNANKKKERNAKTGMEVKPEIGQVPVYVCQEYLLLSQMRVERSRMKKELIVYLLWITTIVFGVLYGRNIAMEYDLSYMTRQSFVENDIYRVTELAHFNKTFRDITSAKQVYAWLKSPFFSQIYDVEYKNNTPVTKTCVREIYASSLSNISGFKACTTFEELKTQQFHLPPRVHRSNFVIGAIRVRQIRVKNETCPVSTVNRTCYGNVASDYSNIDDSNTALAGTKYIADSGNAEYSSNMPTNFMPVTYPNGGWIQDFYVDWYNGTFLTKLDEMERDGWIDEATRAVQVGLQMYNPSADRWIVANFWVEIGITGTFWTSQSNKEMRLVNHDDLLQLVRIIVGILFAIGLWFHVAKIFNELCQWLKSEKAVYHLHEVEQRRFNMMDADEIRSGDKKRTPYWVEASVGALVGALIGALVGSLAVALVVGRLVVGALVVGAAVGALLIILGDPDIDSTPEPTRNRHMQKDSNGWSFGATMQTFGFVSNLVRRFFAKFRNFSAWLCYDIVFVVVIIIAGTVTVVNYQKLQDMGALQDDLFAINANKNYQHLELDWQASQNVMASNLSAIVFFLGAVKLVKFLKLDMQMNLVVRTLRYAMVDLLAFFAFFSICFVAFAVMGQSFFGTEAREFVSVTSTCATQLALLFGTMSLTRVETSDPIFQTVYNYAYLISMSLILINIFVGILVDAFAEQKREMRCSERRMQLSHYSMNVFSSCYYFMRYTVLETFCSLYRSLCRICGKRWEENGDSKGERQIEFSALRSFFDFFFRGQLTLSYYRKQDQDLDYCIHESYTILTECFAQAIQNAKILDPYAEVKIQRDQFIQIMQQGFLVHGAVEGVYKHGIEFCCRNQSKEPDYDQLAHEAWDSLVEYKEQSEKEDNDLEDLPEPELIEKTRSQVINLQARVNAEFEVIRAAQRQILKTLQVIEKQTSLGSHATPSSGSAVARDGCGRINNDGELVTKELCKALKDEMFRREHAFISEADVLNVIKDYEVIRSNNSKPSTGMKASLPTSHLDEGIHSKLSLHIRVESVTIKSMTSLPHFTGNVFCELIVSPDNTSFGIQDEDYEQHIRRTSLVPKADTDRPLGENESWKYRNVFQFNDQPFTIPISSKHMKVKVTVFHVVTGIRMVKICEGEYDRLRPADPGEHDPLKLNAIQEHTAADSLAAADAPVKLYSVTGKDHLSQGKTIVGEAKLKVKIGLLKESEPDNK